EPFSCPLCVSSSLLVLVLPAGNSFSSPDNRLDSGEALLSSTGHSSFSFSLLFFLGLVGMDFDLHNVVGLLLVGGLLLTFEEVITEGGVWYDESSCPQSPKMASSFYNEKGFSE
ncbi:hypothetical protein SDJN02_26277, partial [Cucurbita argyrosperma subsp. argyrosperma]